MNNIFETSTYSRLYRKKNFCQSFRSILPIFSSSMKVSIRYFYLNLFFLKLKLKNLDNC